MRIAETLCAAFVLTGSAAFAASPEQPLQGLDHYIKSALPDWQTPGIAVGVVKDGEIIYARGFGVRQIGREQRVDAHTLFQIASLTKAFTAAAFGRLVDEGKVGWEDPVVDHLPGLRLSDPWVTQHVTIRDMLANRTGVESGGFSVTLQDQQEVLRRGRFAEFSAPFRHYRYSNYMYGVAGQVIAAVAGKRYEDYLKEAIFAPLGMSESGTSPYDFWDEQDVDACFFCERAGVPAGFERASGGNAAMPHWPTNGGPKVLRWRSMDGVAASGCIVSNLGDMLKWLRFNLADGEVDGRQVLSSATARELRAPQVLKNDLAWGRTVWPVVDRAIPSHERSAYALGWFRNSYRGHSFVSHGGGALGMVTFAAMLPELDTGIVVLTNGNSAEIGFMISFRVVDALLGLPARDWNAELLREARAKRVEDRKERERLEGRRLRDTRPSLPLDAYVGEYESAVYGPMRIVESGGRLVLRMPGDNSFARPLEHWHADTFRMSWWQDDLAAFVAFAVDEQARVTAFDAGPFFGHFDRLGAQ